MIHSAHAPSHTSRAGFSRPSVVQRSGQRWQHSVPSATTPAATSPTLADLIHERNHRPLSLPELIALLTPLIDAIHHAPHEATHHGYLHPAGLLHTSAGLALGTMDHMKLPSGSIYGAPELARGGASPRSDVYALAMIAYHLLSGYPPDDHDATPHPLPSGVDRVLARALAFDPQRRYPSPTALLRALHAATFVTAPAIRSVAVRQRWIMCLALVSVITLSALAGLLVTLLL